MKITLVLLLLFAPVLGPTRFQAPSGAQQGNGPSVPDDKSICVLGNVTKPSMLRFRSGITVTQAIKEAGGIPSDRKSKNVRVYSLTTEGTNRIIYVDLEAVRRKPYLDLALQSSDIVEVLFDKKRKKSAAATHNPCFSRPFVRID